MVLNDKWAHACEFLANDLSKLKKITLENCQNQCYLTQNCTHYSWSEDKICFLKQGIVTKLVQIRENHCSQIVTN